MNLLLSGGIVLTGPDWIPRALDVQINGGRIEAIGEPGTVGGAAVLDVTGRLIIPGLVNAHTHSHSLPARGALRSVAVEQAMLHGAWTAGPRAAELSELAASLAATEMIAAGATGAFDLVGQAAGPDPEALWATAQGYAAVGMRAVVAPQVADRSVQEAIPVIGECCGVRPTMTDTPTILSQVRRFVADFPALADVSPAVAPTVPTQCSSDLIWGMQSLAVEHQLRIHVHLAESRAQAEAGEERYGHSLVSELARLGTLSPRLTAAHGVWLSEVDLISLGAAGVTVVTLPGTDLRQGSGIADVRALSKAGVRLAIGTDGAGSADLLDMVEATRLTSLLTRAFDRPASEWMSVEEALTAATEGGARACGWEDVGRIEPGWRADLTFLDLGSRAFRPAVDLANQVVSAARAHDVTDVMVGGRFVYQERTFPGIDLESLDARFRQLAQEWWDEMTESRTEAHRQAGSVAETLAGWTSGSIVARRLL